MFLNFFDRVFGQILVDLRDDVDFDVIMQVATQIGQGPWRCDDDQRPHVVRTHQFFERRRYSADEPVLLKLMPIGRLDCATSWTYARKSATWSVGALLMRWRIVIEEHSFRLEV